MFHPPVSNASSGGDFRAGHCSDGTQTLMGLWYGRVVACFFSPQGDFLLLRERATATPDSTKGAGTVAQRWWGELRLPAGADRREGVLLRTPRLGSP